MGIRKNIEFPWHCPGYSPGEEKRCCLVSGFLLRVPDRDVKGTRPAVTGHLGESYLEGRRVAPRSL